jgi:polyhydroxyalkanoate synthesis regulator phasin
MHPQMIAKQIIDFNKAAFDNTFDTIKILQDNTEKTVKEFVEKATFFPDEGKKVIIDWVETCKKGRTDFKSAIDDNFKTVENIFVGAANLVGQSLYGMAEKTDKSLRDVTHKIRKASVAVVDKSIQTLTVVADSTMLNKPIISQDKTINKKRQSKG